MQVPSVRLFHRSGAAVGRTAVAALTILIVGACSGGGGETTTSAAAPETTVAPTTTGGADTTTTDTTVVSGIDEQEAALLAAAEGEPPLLMYTALGEPIVLQLAEAFEAKYGLEITSLRLSGADLRERFASESEVEVFAADVLLSGEVTTPLWLEFMDNGWIQPMSSELVPRIAEIDDRWVLPNGVSLYLAYLNTLVVNTDLVPPEDVPSTYAELLEPEWTGEIYSQDPSVSNFLLGVYGGLKEQFGDQFLVDLGAQEPIWAEVAPSMAGVAAGEHKGCLVCTVNHMNNFLAEAPDAPVELYYLEDFNLGFSQQGALAAQSPAPNSARLFLSWLLSEEGQTVLATAVGAVSIREDVVIPESRPLAPDFVLVYDYFESSEAARADILSALGFEE